MSETIINGIDVSECEFLECGMCNAQRNCDGYTGIECKYDNEDCYYRQLKRLQEENEKLKKNEQLKKPCLVMPKVKQLAVPIEKYEKLYKALEEIRKLINETCWDYTDISIIPVKETILDKINEVLNDRD